MLSRVLGPQRLRDLAGVIIFGVLSMTMINKPPSAATHDRQKRGAASRSGPLSARSKAETRQERAPACSW